MLETQFAQVSISPSNPPDKFPTILEEYYNAVSLRSGKVLQEPKENIKVQVQDKTTDKPSTEEEIEKKPKNKEEELGPKIQVKNV